MTPYETFNVDIERYLLLPAFLPLLKLCRSKQTNSHFANTKTSISNTRSSRLTYAQAMDNSADTMGTPL